MVVTPGSERVINEKSTNTYMYMYWLKDRWHIKFNAQA